MKATKSLVVLPPMFFNSEARTAVAFIKALREFGVKEIVGVTPRVDDSPQVEEMLREIKDVKMSPFPVIKGPLISGPLDYFLLNIKKLIGGFDFSLNLYYVDVPVGLDASYIIYPPSALMSKKDIISRRSGIKKMYASFMEKVVERTANSEHLVCSSNYIKQMVKNDFNYDCSVIYPPVDVFWKPYVANDKEDLVVGIGKYVEPKHWDEFINIAKIVREKNKEIKFKIIGGLDNVRSSREYFDKLKKMASDDVELLTDLEEREKWELISKAKVVLHCMRNDNFGLGVAEAMSAGAVPVMYNATGSYMDISDQGRYGFLYNNVYEAANIILNLMMDDELYVKQKELSLQRAREFSFSTFKRRTFNLLEQILNNRK